MESHLLQMRGLKLIIRSNEILCRVASFTDAWIETCIIRQIISLQMSHLLQMRGLKLVHIKKGINIVGRIFYRCVD